MGIMKTIMWIIIGLILLSYFQPGLYLQLKNKAGDVFGDFINNTISDTAEEKFNYTLTEEGKDYGQILGFIECEDDAHCHKYFKIEGIKCGMQQTCYLEQGENNEQ